MRILGIGVLAALIAGAVGAGTVQAAKYSSKTWTQYKHCPYENPEVNECVYGATRGGATGGSFQYGKVLVKLSKPVVIQTGSKETGEGTQLVAPIGVELVESPELTITKGLNLITPKIEEEAEWPQALKESFAAAKKNHETKAYAKIEPAGTECYEKPGCISVQNLINREGAAFTLPLKVKITSPWLTSLGGGPCYVGNDAHPIVQHLTSEGAGSVGELTFNPEFTQVEVSNSRLVDLGWHIEEGSGASGCGGAEYEAYVDNAIDRLLEISPDRTGMTILTGDLFNASVEGVKEQAEKGNV